MQSKNEIIILVNVELAGSTSDSGTPTGSESSNSFQSHSQSGGNMGLYATLVEHISTSSNLICETKMLQLLNSLH